MEPEGAAAEPDLDEPKGEPAGREEPEAKPERGRAAYALDFGRHPPEAAKANGERSYRVAELGLDASGHPRATVKWTLPSRVYDRRTALKFAAYEARKLPRDGDGVLLIIDPGDRFIEVLAMGSGRRVSCHVATRASRMAGELLGLRKPRRRTTRPRRAWQVRRR